MGSEMCIRDRNNAGLALEAEKYKNDFGKGVSLPMMIENGK